jgi:glycosyltransferase involved in cell wall biosynthesis
VVQDANNEPCSREAGGRPKILILITEDWFAVSHYLPLVRALTALPAEVAVATRVRDKGEPIEAAGARLVPFDFRRGEPNPLTEARVAARLVRLLRAERPDVVHAIALKPIALAALVRRAAPASRLAIHLTGTGLVGTAASRAARAAFGAVRRLVALSHRRPDTWLFVQNPDDWASLARAGARDPSRMTLLGGAGVDPSHFAALPPPTRQPLRAAFVGRLVWSKGVDVLVEAQRRLGERGIELELLLAGLPDAQNPRALSRANVEAWARQPGILWPGHVEDVREVWREAAIAIVPSRGGEGLPRAMLEAAACARPLIASDVPGCRHFLRHEIEGLLVPPGDAEALSSAIARLAGDADLRLRMGEAARQRVLSGFTEADMAAAVRQGYRALLAGSDRKR